MYNHHHSQFLNIFPPLKETPYLAVTPRYHSPVFLHAPRLPAPALGNDSSAICPYEFAYPGRFR